MRHVFRELLRERREFVIQGVERFPEYMAVVADRAVDGEGRLFPALPAARNAEQAARCAEAVDLELGACLKQRLPRRLDALVRFACGRQDALRRPEPRLLGGKA